MNSIGRKDGEKSGRLSRVAAFAGNAFWMLVCASFWLAIILSLAACSGQEGEAEPIAEPPEFEDSVYRYCMAQDERFLMDLMNRISAASPDQFESHSLRYEEMLAQANWMDDQLDLDRKELVVRFTATKGGEPAQLFSLSEIDPETCALSRTEVHMGWDRFEIDRATSFAVPDK